MLAKSIPMPGLTTRHTTTPEVNVIADIDTDVKLVLSYHLVPDDDCADMAGTPLSRVEITFDTVIEYRFFRNGDEYDDVRIMPRSFTPAQDSGFFRNGDEYDDVRVPQLTRGPERANSVTPRFELNEVLSSQYVERINASGRFSVGPAMGGIYVRDVKHYEVSWENYGSFIIIALGVDVRETDVGDQ